MNISELQPRATFLPLHRTNPIPEDAKQRCCNQSDTMFFVVVGENERSTGEE